MPWSKIKFYYDENLASGTLAASSTGSGFSVDNILDRLEGSFWRAANTNDQFITWDAGEGNIYTADYFAFAGHNLFTIRGEIKLQYSFDNSVWHDCFSKFLPSDNKAKVQEFSSITARFWRVAITPADSSSSSSCSSSFSSCSSSFSSSSSSLSSSSSSTSVSSSSSSSSSESNSSSSSSTSSCSSSSSSLSSSSSSWALHSFAQLAVCFWGEKTELDYASRSFDPNAQKTNANVNITQGGYVSGIHTKHTERQLRLAFSDADSTLYDKIKAWNDDNGLKNFFVAWEDTEHGDDVFLMRSTTNFNNPLTRGGLFRNISINLRGRAE